MNVRLLRGLLFAYLGYQMLRASSVPTCTWPAEMLQSPARWATCPVGDRDWLNVEACGGTRPWKEQYGELGTVRRYPYWSDRRIREIAAHNNIKLERHWQLTIRSPTLSIFPQIEAAERFAAPQCDLIARRMGKGIGLRAVEDFVTPPSVDFAKGAGGLTVAFYKRQYTKKVDGKALVVHTWAKSSDGCRVEICLFGSIENYSGYQAGSQTEVPRWRSSSTEAIEEFVASRGTINESQYDEDEVMVVEIVRTVHLEGMASGKHVFRRLRSAEWFAEVYLDVELTKDRWDLTPSSNAT